MTDNIAILVTGMHRSGTSALARTISLLGASLPKDIVPPNDGNPDGHWEPQTVVDLNDRILADAGSDVYGIAEIDADWFTASRVAPFIEQAEALVRTAYDGAGLIVLKDPRTALMLPIWETALERCGYRTVHILPLRHPEAVADSLRRRHLKTIPYDGWPSPRGETVWLRYTLAAVRGSRGHPRAFVDHGAFMQDWRRAMARAASQTGLDWPRSGAEAEREIDAFLRGAPQAEPDRILDPAARVGDLAALDLAGLAAALHAVLVRHGDDGARVDAIHEEYRARLRSVRDLIPAFEGLYPLIWRYYEEAERSRGTRGDEQTPQAGAGGDVQRLWRALSRSNEERAALRIDLSSARKHVGDLERAIETDAPRRRAEQQLAEAQARFETERYRLESEKADLDGNGLRLMDSLDRLEAERHRLELLRQRLEDDKAALADEITQMGDAIDAERQQLEDERTTLAADYERFANASGVERRHLAEEIDRLRSSTSWRVTKPLRALVRLVKG